MLWRIILLSASLTSPYYYAWVAHEGFETTSFLIVLFEAIFALDIAIQFLTEYTPEGETIPVRNLGKISHQYIHQGDFYFDAVSTIPITFFLDNSKPEIWRLLFLIKVIRIGTALEIYNVRAMVDICKNRNKQRVLKQIERDPTKDDDLDTDYNSINSFFNMSYSLKIFKLFLMILSLSYFTGMIWFIFCE